jgi:hypothetical protein
MRDVTREQVENLLNRHLPDWKPNAAGTEAVAVCPRCHGGKRRERSFSVRLDEGVFICNRQNHCGTTGSFRDLCELLGEPVAVAEPGLELNPSRRSRKTAPRTPVRAAVSQPVDAPAEPVSAEELEKLAREDASAGRERLLARGITEDTITRLGVTWTPWKASVNSTGMVMPYPEGRKIRSFRDGRKTFSQPEKARGLFGSHLLSESGPIILTAGETDVMAWTQAGFSAVCLANGEGNPPRDGEADLLRGRDVVIAYDLDDAGQRGAEKVRDALQGIASRVRIARYPEGREKDASAILEALGTEDATRIFTAMLEDLDHAEPVSSSPWADDLDLSRLGYRIERDGLYLEKTDRRGEPALTPPIAPRPIWVSGDADDISTRKPFLELSWFDGRGRRLRGWFPSSVRNDRKTLLDEDPDRPGVCDGPVTLANIKQISTWLTVAAGAIRGERQRIASRTGWATLEDGSRMLCGPGIEGLTYTGDLRAKGSLSAWSEALDELHDMGDRGFIAWSVLGLSAASPLHRMLGGNNPVLGLIGTNGKGKTTAFLLALSMWSEPSKLLAPEDSTANGTRVHAEKYPDLPVASDDLQGLLERNPAGAQSLIYWMGNGQMKKRSGRDGSAQGGGQRHGASFYLAEDPITEGMLGGAGRRSIEITGHPMDGKRRADRIEQIACENAGAPFAALAAHLTDNQEALVRDVRALEKDLQGDPNLRAGDARTIAMTLTGVRIVCAVTGKPLPDMDGLRTFIVSQAGRHRQNLRDRAQEAWTAMLEMVSSVAREGGGRVGNRDIPMGWGDDVNPASPEVLAVLKAHGDSRSLQRDWLARGWIVGDTADRPRKTIKVGGRPIKVWRPTREGLRAAGLLDEPEEVIAVVTQEREPDLPSELDNLPAEPSIPDWGPDSPLMKRFLDQRGRFIPVRRYGGEEWDSTKLDRLEDVVREGPAGPSASWAIRSVQAIDAEGMIRAS